MMWWRRKPVSPIVEPDKESIGDLEYSIKVLKLTPLHERKLYLQGLGVVANRELPAILEERLLMRAALSECRELMTTLDEDGIFSARDVRTLRIKLDDAMAPAK